jgi:septal ring factor EnvC (AmiA/AmiB activator)
MKCCAFVMFVALAATTPAYSQSSKPRPKPPETWYERALRQINPDNINFGEMWEQRKRAMLDQIRNRYFRYSLATTLGIVVLLTLLSIQQVSHKRSLDHAAQSIADVLRHDEYSRQTAREAIRRYNEHIESCNRAIETRQDGFSKSISDAEAELHRVRRELADTREENKALRNEAAKSQKLIAEMKAAAAKTQPVQTEMEFVPAQYIARINSLEKQLRDEQRKNQSLKGTSVNDRRG